MCLTTGEEVLKGGSAVRRVSRFQISRLQRQVVDEATAIVEGRVVDAGGDRRWAPRWGWVNKLAHGSWEDLTRLAARRNEAGSTWEAAASYLATEMLTRSQDPEHLLALQRMGLVPMELDVMSGWIPKPRTPKELVQLVGSGIDRAGPQSESPRR